MDGGTETIRRVVRDKFLPNSNQRKAPKTIVYMHFRRSDDLKAM